MAVLFHSYAILKVLMIAKKSLNLMTPKEVNNLLDSFSVLPIISLNITVILGPLIYMSLSLKNLAQRNLKRD